MNTDNLSQKADRIADAAAAAPNAARPAGRRLAFLAGAVALGALVTAGAVGSVLLAPPGAAIAQGIPNLGVAVPGQASFADVVEKVKPAVVSVRVKVLANQVSDERGPSSEDFGGNDNGPMERFFRRFQQEPGQRGMRPSPRRFGEAQGSGFFVSKDGYIVTNNHVVAKGADVQVTTDDGRVLTAKVIGTDPKSDLALLKTEENGPFPSVSFAGKAPRVGDWVIAVGNPFGLGGTVTAGIVSARGRDIGAGPYDDFLQIDAPVNHGNSGGPTFNLAGEVVGVNTAIASPTGGNVGIAFAIPAENAQKIVAEIRASGTVARGFLGVQIQPVTQDIADGIGFDKTEGALVARVEGDSPAAKAGVKTGDVVVTLNGKAIKDARELSREVAALQPGASADLKVWHEGKTRDISVKLGRLPGEKTAALSGDKAEERGADFGRLGLTLAPAASVAGVEGKGVVVTGVEPGSQAEQKGLKTGDVIAEVSGRAVETPADVRKAVAESRKAGKKAVLFRLDGREGARFVALAVPTA